MKVVSVFQEIIEIINWKNFITKYNKNNTGNETCSKVPCF